MPYVTSIERSYRREGMRKGIRSLLKVKFGDEGLQIMPAIENIHDDDQLEAILQALETAKTPDDVRRLWVSPP